MICAHSNLACPFCRCRLSTWLRHNPDYSKLIIERQDTKKPTKKKIGRPRKMKNKNGIQKKSKRKCRTSKKRPTCTKNKFS